MYRLIPFLVPFVLLLAQSPRVPKDARVGYESITAKDLSAHLHFIASPELEGRETTFRGQKVAARYIASVFQKLGLKPIGDSASYFQHFPVEVTRPSDQSIITVATKQGVKKFAFRTDFVTVSTQDTILAGPVIFIGYMDTRPDSMLTKGRLVMALAGRKQDSHDTTVPAVRRMQFLRQFTGSLATLIIADDSGSGSIGGMATRYSSVLDKGLMRLPGAETRGRFSFQSPYV
ncbi:MAG: hypothetical protein AABZ02_06285, partial [Bacteroidota bacterium]